MQFPIKVLKQDIKWLFPSNMHACDCTAS